MKQDLRDQLIERLLSRTWTKSAAEDAAAAIAELYGSGERRWSVRRSQVAGKPDIYRVSRLENSVPVYDSRLERVARDVAAALNEIEGQK